jgi:hypothetical protein
MPDIFHTLINHDLDLLMTIAGKWGLNLAGSTQVEVAKEMAGHMQDSALINSVREILPDEVEACLLVLVKMGGKMKWSYFIRQYGMIREMGIARREREEPFDMPVSIAESLWYYGMIGRAFLDVGGELREYAYIPDELLRCLPKDSHQALNLIAIPAEPNMVRVIDQANDSILDHLTSYLAAVRSGRVTGDLGSMFGDLSISECETLLQVCGLLDSNRNVNPEATRDFLAKSRGEAFIFLFASWLTSSSFNELKLMPGIVAEGVWKNDPLKTRQTLFEYISQLPVDTWWSIDRFVAGVKSECPDFQRPAGGFESWMFRSPTTGKSLRGFENWDLVDGALIRYLLNGPLYWLGYIDLGRQKKGTKAQAFRVSRMAANLIQKRPIEGLREETGRVTALRNGRLACPQNLPRAVRYQLARFCDWCGVNDKGYLYQLTPASLINAVGQGLKVEQLMSLLKRYAVGSLPASLVTSLQRWAENGAQASITRVTILKVSSPDMMLEIRNSPIGRFLGEQLNQNVVTLPIAAVQKVIPRLLELGYFCEQTDDVLSIQERRE